MSDLLKKYNRPGPRYTSYPPVPFWKGAPLESEWISHLKTAYDKKTGMDLYVHVPFCERLCYYCGCNRQITKNHKVEDQYVELLLKEWQLYKDRLGFTPKINSLHFGGGTPTFLSAENLQKIIHHLTIIRSDSFQGSIEVDPRTVNTDQMDVLVHAGFKRFSLGIQDFDPAVQKSINRFQSFELVENVVKELRARNIESLNFDVIYGLPNQSIESIEKTFELVEKLSPDQIAFYSYAHLPDKLMNQRLIKNDELPGPELKQKLYETGKALLLKAGYFDIGMDHFARPGNFLYHAKVQNQLHRNFMGYVNKKSSVLLGLGPSSISDSSMSFVQNVKAYTDYENAINESRLPIVSGHTHNTEELVAQKMIIELMCTDQTIIFESMPHYEEILMELREFEKDHIIRLEGERVIVLPEGKKFIRNVAMTFDFHFREKNPINKFSQTI